MKLKLVCVLPRLSLYLALKVLKRSCFQIKIGNCHITYASNVNFVECYLTESPWLDINPSVGRLGNGMSVYLLLSNINYFNNPRYAIVKLRAYFSHEKVCNKIKHFRRGFKPVGCSILVDHIKVHTTKWMRNLTKQQPESFSFGFLTAIRHSLASWMGYLFATVFRSSIY